MLIWNDGSANMTCLLDFLDEPRGLTDTLIATFEKAAGVKGDFEWSDEHAGSWYGLHGTFDGEIFTVYTHKSGRLKIGGDPDGKLNVVELKAALFALYTPAVAA